jgi:hypothetical protein
MRTTLPELEALLVVDAEQQQSQNSSSQGGHTHSNLRSISLILVLRPAASSPACEGPERLCAWRSYGRVNLATSRCMTKQKYCSTKKSQPAKPAALATSPLTKVDVASMLDKLAPQMAQLLDGALDAIAASFQAMRTVVVDKEVVDCGSITTPA